MTKTKPKEAQTQNQKNERNEVVMDQIATGGVLSQTPATPSQTFLLIDAHALIYRAYYAFPELTTEDGTLVNAVFGFTKAVLTAIRDFEPEFIAVAFDHPKPTKRHEQYKQYKAHREKMPDDLIPQIEIIKKVVATLNFPTFEQEGWEADDLIGTLAAQAQDQLESEDISEDLLIVIVTGDKDTFQLVNDKVHVWLPARTKSQQPREYDEAGVKAKIKVRPDQVVDLKALMGDASDNIPGVKGIGEKTAVKLLDAFGTLEGLYQAIEKQEQGKDLLEDHSALLKGATLKKLKAEKEQAVLSQELATIQIDAPIQLSLESCRVSGYNKQEAIDLFDELSFKSLIKELPADEFELGVEDALF